jgi:Uma2 family endonuclease
MANPCPLGPADYLAREDLGPARHEYVDGELHAMSGGRRAHNLIAANLLARAWGAARQVPGCQVFGSDMKVHVPAHNCFYYPDLSVCCDPLDRHELFLSSPCFIVEVLSRATALIDSWEKRSRYATLPSLHEYVIVDSERMQAEIHRREEGHWQASVLDQPEHIVEASCLELRLSLRQIYEGVNFEQAAAPRAVQYVEVAEVSLNLSLI